ncbi:MAG: hypothetical protein ACE15F_13100 [bacterium]
MPRILVSFTLLGWINFHDGSQAASLSPSQASDQFQKIYSTSFETGAGAEWSHTQTETLAQGSITCLGQFGNQNVSLGLANLQPHTEIEVTFDLYINQSWDGNNTYYGPDIWELNIAGGPALLKTTFSNVSDAQAYPGSYPGGNNPARTGAAASNTLGFSFMGDTTYHLSYRFAHTDSTLTVLFSASGLLQGDTGGWTVQNDEGWALDNVEVQILPSEILPTPTAPLAFTPTPTEPAVYPTPTATPGLGDATPTPETPPEEIAELIVNGPPRSGRLADFFDENWYWIQIPQTGVYRIETYVEPGQPLTYLFVNLWESLEDLAPVAMNVNRLDPVLEAGRIYYVSLDGDNQGEYAVSIAFLDVSPTPTPVLVLPTPTPSDADVPPRAAGVYELDRSTLEECGWWVIPGGFDSRPAGVVYENIIFPPGLFLSSQDEKGIAVSVQPGQVVFLLTRQAVATQGRPALVRAVMRGDSDSAQVVVGALKGNVTSGDNVDGSIGMTLYKTSTALTGSEAKIDALFQADEGLVINPFLQISGNENGMVTVWIDRIEIYLLVPGIHLPE